MDVNECIEAGLLKHSERDLKKAQRSLLMASNRLNKAVRLGEAGFFEDSLTNSYSAMFHAGRAILFRDGFKERSHYALFVYIKEKYRDFIEPRILNELDLLRSERHEILYSLDTIAVNKDETADIIIVAKDFLKCIEKLIKP